MGPVQGLPDEMGDPTWVYQDVPGVCELQQVQAWEVRDGAPFLVSLWRLYVLPNVGLTGWDSVTVDGHKYTVDGEPWPVWNPRTRSLSHYEMNVRRVT